MGQLALVVAFATTAAAAAASAAAAADSDIDATDADTTLWQHYGPYGNGYGPFGNGNGNGNGNGGVNSPLGSSSSSGNGFPGIFGSTLLSAMHYRTIHGILASVAIVVLFPVGSILMRVVPGRAAIWVHAIFQTLAFLLYIAGAALGLYLIKTVQIPFAGGNLVRPLFSPSVLLFFCSVHAS